MTNGEIFAPQVELESKISAKSHSGLPASIVVRNFDIVTPLPDSMTLMPMALSNGLMRAARSASCQLPSP